MILSISIVQEAVAQQGPVSLEPIVVTATRQEEEVSRVPSHVTVLTKEDIQSSGAGDIGELLRTEAGLTVVNTSGSSPTGIQIDGRGFNNGGGNGGRMLILIDGRRANQADSSVPDWAAIPIDSIERVEVIRGSASALYGDNAVAGVINIITKRGGAGDPSFKAGMEAGSFDSWKRNLGFSGDHGAASYYLYGGYESTDGSRDNSDYRASNYVGSLTFRKSESTRLFFRGSYLGAERSLPGALTEEEIDDVGRDGSVTDDQGGNHQAQFDAGFDSQLGKSHWVELSGGQTLRNGQTTVTFPGSGDTRLGTDGRSSAVSGKYRVIGSAGKMENRLMLGLDLHKERVASESFNNYPDPQFPFIVEETTSYKRNLLGAYAHDELSLTPSLILTLSGRYDWSKFRFIREETDQTTSITTRSSGNRDFRVWSPKTGLVYRTSPFSNVYATWSRSFRFPNRDELTGLFGLTPELDPERATTIEFGSQFLVAERYQASVSVFRMTVDDEIVFVPPDTGAFEFGRNENVPEVQHNGAETSLMIRYSRGLKIRGSYTVTDTEITKGPFEGSEMPITPKHAGSMTIDMGDSTGFRLSWTTRFVGKRHLASDLDNEQDKLSKYSVTDARLAYAGETYEAFFGVQNVFNREYEDFGGVGGFPFGSRIGVNPSPERNYLGGVSVRF